MERSTGTTDDYGNPHQSWVPLLSAWGDVLESLGRERLAAGRIEASKTATIRLLVSTATAAITAADRVLARGSVWNIRSVAAVGRDNALIELLVEEGVAT